jgi:uncharacterized integral membrane protein
MRFFKVIITTAIVLLGIVFIIENLEMFRQTVQIRYDLYFTYLQSPDVPLWVIILFCFFLGVFTTSLYGIYEMFVQRQTIRQLRHNLEIMADELRAAGAAPAPASKPEAPPPPPPGE